MGSVSRRRINWTNVRDFKSILAFWVATASGAGLFPVAPGTMGTLVGLPIAYWTQGASPSLRILFWLVLFLVGTWAAQVFDETMKTQDNQCIVIDEVVGMGITAWTAGESLNTWIFAFLAFRFFDILKPPPIRKIDTWSKNQTSRGWSGFGVMADDVIASFEGLLVVILLQKLGFLL
jgi:phosphatidylglycerophosphatase A